MENFKIIAITDKVLNDFLVDLIILTSPFDCHHIIFVLVIFTNQSIRVQKCDFYFRLVIYFLRFWEI